MHKPVGGIIGMTAAYSILLTIAAPQMPHWLILASGGLAALILWLSWVDFHSFRIPDHVNLLVALLGILVISQLPNVTLWLHLCAGFAGYLVFRLTGDLLWRYLGREALGQGDAKLLGAGAIWIGFAGIPSVILVASATGILFAFTQKNMHSGGGSMGIPFGPFLGTGIFIVWLYGPFQI